MSHGHNQVASTWLDPGIIKFIRRFVQVVEIVEIQDLEQCYLAYTSCVYFSP